MTAKHDTSLLSYLGQTVAFTDVSLVGLLPLGNTAKSSTPRVGRVLAVVVSIENSVEPSLLVDVPGCSLDYYAVSEMADLRTVEPTPA